MGEGEVGVIQGGEEEGEGKRQRRAEGGKGWEE